MTGVAYDLTAWQAMVEGRQTFWRQVSPTSPFVASCTTDIAAASARFIRFAPVISALFPNECPDGLIESPLLHLGGQIVLPDTAPDHASSRIFVKADHLLPVAGSVKARGGFHEVMCIAERVAGYEGISADQSLALVGPEARAVFARHCVVVASTGNLGYAIGIFARALGFAVQVHMSADAKAWKKDRLRASGSEVIEHSGDYGAAVTAARMIAANDTHMHFVDDERSPDLFFGYAAAAARLAAQLDAAGVSIGTNRPLHVYLPCGVGGAPAGILYGLKTIFGEHVSGYFAEPTASPCMLLRLLARLPEGASVYDVGLDNHTEADGLAVARASELAVDLVGPHVAGSYTVTDREMLRWVAIARDIGLRIEPAAATALAGACERIWLDDELSAQPDIRDGIHVAWTTGGGLLPDREYERLLAAGDT